MILTEDQARTKWCPFARSFDVSVDGAPSVNRESGGKPDKWCLCIASDCMAWRWSDPETERHDMVLHGAATGLTKPEGEGWEHDGTWWTRPTGERRRGYCSLAGRAE